MYGNDSGATLAATGAGLTILGVSIPMPVVLSIAVVMTGVGIFLFVAWRKRGGRSE